MSTTNATKDRELHFVGGIAANIVELLEWAVDKGVVKKLLRAFQYLRTYGGAGESTYRTHIGCDMFYNPERPSFVAKIERRNVDKWEHFMTIGMIWDDGEQDWSFHS